MEKQGEGRWHPLSSSKEKVEWRTELLLGMRMKAFKVEISHPKWRNKSNEENEIKRFRAQKL